MIKKIMERLLEERGIEYIYEVSAYFSWVKGRKVISIDFEKDIIYEEFLNKVTGLINEEDISCQDSCGITIDLTNDFLNRIINYTILECKNEMENLKK